jgi:IS1 family transposase
LALTYDETQIDEVVETLFRALDRKKTRFVQVTLGRRSYEVHESLWQAIGNALVSWQLDMDLVKALTAQGARRI